MFERDAQGRIIREIQNGHAIEHSYDSRSRLTRTLSDLGADITHGYDDAGLPESVKAIVQGMPHPWEARLQHDRLGRETLRTMTGGVACAMQYDGVGRPSRQSVTRGGHSLYNRSYRWDDDFLLSHAHDAISGSFVRYFYDDFGSLAEAEYGDGARQWRNPDIMGNVYDSADRTDRTYARGGQLREDRRWRYHYDKQGNLVLKTKRKIPPSAETPQDNRKSVFGLFSSSNTSKEGREQEELIAWHPGDYAYTWLPNGMLGSVTRPDGKVVAFKYDALGRRVEKTFNGRVHRYLWDGNVPLHEWTEESEVITWLFEQDTFVPAAKLVANGECFSIVSDYLGTPLQAYDKQGNKVWEQELDIYGRQRKRPSAFIPFKYQGQYEDAETGLYYNRFRYYDPNAGSYISQDPIGLMGENPTLYGYVSDSNINIDILGLTDFYITPSGKAIPATGYRYVSKEAPYLDELKSTKTIPANSNGTYFSFDKFDTPNPKALQVPHDASVKASFDTLQIVDDVEIPRGKWGKADYLEPITKDFPEFGKGGATQAITHKEIKVDKIEHLDLH